MQFPRKIAMRHQMASLPHHCFRGRSIIISGIGWGAGLLLSACGPSGSGGAGGAVNPPNVAATIPRGSPEYQALAQEACQLINQSNVTTKTVSANLMKATNRETLYTTNNHYKSFNAHFSDPWVLRSELKQVATTSSEDAQELNSSREYTFDYEIDLKSIRRVMLTSCNANRDTSTGLSIQDDSISHSSSHRDAPLWVVNFETSVADGSPGVKSFARGSDGVRHYCQSSDVAYFTEKAKAERLTSVLKKLATLAKAG